MLSNALSAPPSESDCSIDLQLTIQLNDGNVTNDSRHVELNIKFLIEVQIEFSRAGLT